MPETFFSIVWPLVFLLVILAGVIVCIAALATMTMAIARARLYRQEKGDSTAEHVDEVERSSHAHAGSNLRVVAVETYTTDGIHYTPIL
jgi:hypothetical protein